MVGFGMLAGVAAALGLASTGGGAPKDYNYRVKAPRKPYKRTTPKPQGRGRMFRSAGLGGFAERVRFYQHHKNKPLEAILEKAWGPRATLVKTLGELA
jgi:hypothetical protein